MNENSTVVRFPQPEVVDDPLTEVLRAGARRLLAQAIEAEAEAFLAGMAERRLADGHPGSFGTARALNAPSRPGSARSRCSG